MAASPSTVPALGFLFFIGSHPIMQFLGFYYPSAQRDRVRRAMEKRVNTFAVVLLWVAATVGCWLLFVASSYSSHELWLCPVFTALTVLMVHLAWRQIDVRFSPRWNQVIEVWRLPWYVLSGTWEMFVILVKDLVGRHPGSFFRVTPFRTAEGSEGASQTILATGYTTVAPNFIVIGIVENTLFFHQVQRSEVPRMVRDIEALQ